MFVALGLFDFEGLMEFEIGSRMRSNILALGSRSVRIVILEIPTTSVSGFCIGCVSWSVSLRGSSMAEYLVM